MIFCTLFNWAYLPQGIALYRSLERTAGEDFVLYVLCVDEYTAEVLGSLDLDKLRIVTLAEIEDEALLAVKPYRSIGEYCWTLTTPLVLYVQDLFPSGTVVTYVDADIAFFASPKLILDELGDRSIFIHEHDFAPEFAHLAATSGRFNVGVSAFRKDAEGRACIERWRRQCIDECVMDPAAGKCGDQNYLDEWPSLYPGLVVSANPGVGLAPWNVGKHRIERRDGALLTGEQQVVFYHFHGLRLMRPRFGVRPTVAARGDYRLSPEVLERVYRPYAAELWRIAAKIKDVLARLGPVPDLQPRIEDGQILFSLFGLPLPVEHNNKTLAVLYGFDEARPSTA